MGKMIFAEPLITHQSKNHSNVLEYIVHMIISVHLLIFGYEKRGIICTFFISVFSASRSLTVRDTMETLAFDCIVYVLLG